MIRAAGRPATEPLTFQNEILIFAEEDHKGTDFPNEMDLNFQFAELPVFEFRTRGRPFLDRFVTSGLKNGRKTAPTRPLPTRPTLNSCSAGSVLPLVAARWRAGGRTGRCGQPFRKVHGTLAYGYRRGKESYRHFATIMLASGRRRRRDLSPPSPRWISERTCPASQSKGSFPRGSSIAVRATGIAEARRGSHCTDNRS
eukprot:COSAG03_NODE_849_length_5637_cov_3.297941_4_plen_199_part_00